MFVKYNMIKSNCEVWFGFLFLFIIVLLSVLVYISASKGGLVESFSNEESSNQQEITDLDLLSSIQNNNILMVKVYADWCGHCKNIKPEWDTFYNEYNGKKVGINTVSVASLEESNSLTPKVFDILKYEVRGYPSILKIYKGNGGLQVEECKGSRTVDNWLTHAKQPKA